MAFQQNAFQHNAFQVQVPGTAAAASTSPSFATNANSPQLADLGRAAGFGLLFMIPLAQAPRIIPPVSGAPQLVDLTQQAVITRPTMGPQGPTVRQFTAGPLQIDLTQQAVLFRPQPARQGLPPPLIRAAPQLIDLTLQAQTWEPIPLPQGPVPAPTSAPPQADPTQIQPDLSLPAVAPLTPSSQPLRTLAVPQQVYADGPSSLWASQRAGQTPPVIPTLAGAPQPDPTQLAAKLFPALVPPPIVPNPIAAFPVTLPQDEERPTRIVWPSLRSGQTTPVIAGLAAAPQAIDLTQQGSVWRSVIGPSLPLQTLAGAPQQVDLTQQAQIFVPGQPAVAVLGPTVEMIPPVPPQDQLDVNYSALWTSSTFSPSAPKVVPPIVVDTGSVPGWVPGKLPKKARKPPVQTDWLEAKSGPVMRPGQVFGEEFPLSPDIGTYTPSPVLRAAVAEALAAARAAPPIPDPAIARKGRAARAVALLRLFMEV